MTGEVRLERVGMSELLRAHDATVRERVLVYPSVPLQVPVIGEMRSAVGALERLLAGVYSAMRLHALQVVEGGAAQVAQVGARLQATAQVTVQTVLLGERLAASVARVRVHLGMYDGVPLDGRQPVGGEQASVERALEDPLGSVPGDDVSLVFNRAAERHVAVRTAERLLRMAAGVSSERTCPGASLAARRTHQGFGFRHRFIPGCVRFRRSGYVSGIRRRRFRTTFNVRTTMIRRIDRIVSFARRRRKVYKQWMDFAVTAA